MEGRGELFFKKKGGGGIGRQTPVPESTENP